MQIKLCSDISEDYLMDFKNKNKYLYYGLTAFLVIAASILFYYIIFHFAEVTEGIKSFFKTTEAIIFGLVIAYLLTPILNYIENKIFKRHLQQEKNQKRIRVISIIITLVIFLGLLYGFFRLIIPEIASSISKIRASYSVYQHNFEIWFNDILKKYPDLEKDISVNYAKYSEMFWTYFQESIIPKLDDWVKILTTGVFSAFRIIFNFVIGIIMSVYLMYNKEAFSGRAKKIVYALMKKSSANIFIHNVRYTNKTFINFFVGKIIDSIIIGFICYILTMIMGVPYALLISVIIGVTNVIPLFGPFIGAIPSAFLVLMEDPKKCLYFIIMIIILQQFDGNILGPKIIGSSTGLSGFWVIVAITLFGAWFGLIGWIIGVPLFAVIYTTIKAYVNAKLQDKELETETEKYIRVNCIDNNNNYIMIPKDEVTDVATSFKKKSKIKLFKESIEKNNSKISSNTSSKSDKDKAKNDDDDKEKNE